MQKVCEILYSTLTVIKEKRLNVGILFGDTEFVNQFAVSILNILHTPAYGFSIVIREPYLFIIIIIN